MTVVNVVKGTRVHVVRFIDAKLPALSGVQLKLQATREDFWGTVRSIRGNAPTVEESTVIVFKVQPDGTPDDERVDVYPNQVVEAINP